MSGPVTVVKKKLFIGNLDPETQEDELNDLFSAFGVVLEASVIKDYGFIHYGSVEEAEKAASAMNNTEFHGKRLRVELSTSTVRHRPGQPEPTSTLRHSRALTKAGNNSSSRYSSATTASGFGPIRHNASGWIRNGTRPYNKIPVGYGGYDRARFYDVRSDSHQYYDNRHDVSYDTEYGAPIYPSNSANRHAAVHNYRNLPPYPRADGYGLSRPNDRRLSASTIAPYYVSEVVPQRPPPVGDPYYGYDAYEKHYDRQLRDPQFPGPPLYTNYNNNPYGIANSRGPPFRHDLPLSSQQSHEVYPPPYRQHQLYPDGSYHPPPYYGVHQH